MDSPASRIRVARVHPHHMGRIDQIAEMAQAEALPLEILL